MKKRLQKIFLYWPELLVLLLCGVLLLCEIGGKKGYHMDELLSFELANAQFNPWIVPTQPQGRLAKFVEREIQGENAAQTFRNLAATVKDVLERRGASRLLSYQADVYEEPVWISRETFIDYVTVNEKDDFNYLSVYFNVKDDNHPPLHFMALHTVSSIFQGSMTPLMGCSINLVCVLGILALLMKLGRELAGLLGFGRCGRFVGLFAALLYGACAGALATTLLIRMYAMLAFFCMALFAVHLKKLFETQGTGRGFESGNGKLILVTVLGFWTQYFFLFYCLILAAVTAVILCRRKRFRELWGYVRSMVTAAVIGVALFPFAVSDVFASGRGVEALENLSAGLAGYGERLLAFGRILVMRTGAWTGAALLLTTAVCAAICLLRRGRGAAQETERAQKAAAQGTETAQQTEAVQLAETAQKAAAQAETEKAVQAELWALLLLPVAGYFLLAARMSPYLVDRYIMPIFAFVSLILTIAAACAAHRAGVGLLRADGAAAPRGLGNTADETSGADEVAGSMGAGEAVGFPGAGGAKEEAPGAGKTLGAAACLVLVALIQFFSPGRYQDNYLYPGYEQQENLARQYAQLPCICVYEGVGYYENLPEFTHYARTLLVKMEELRERTETQSVSSLQELVVVLKKKAWKAELCEVMAGYGLKLERELWQTQEQEDDEVLLFVHTEQ